MRIEEPKALGYPRKIYYYRSDLEAMPTGKLLQILSLLRKQISMWSPPIHLDCDEYGDDKRYVMEGKMVEFSWDDNNEYYAVFWMVKDVLSKRPHVPNSKQERKAARQMSAKTHKKIKTLR